MAENYLNYHLINKIHYHVCLLIKKLRALIMLIGDLPHFPSQKCYSLHWYQKYSSKIRTRNIVQTFHMVWKPYIMNNTQHNKHWQFYVPFIFINFSDLYNYVSIPSMQRDVGLIFTGVRQ